MFWHITIGVYFLAGVAVAIFNKRYDASAPLRESALMVLLGPVLFAICIAMLAVQALHNFIGRRA